MKRKRWKSTNAHSVRSFMLWGLLILAFALALYPSDAHAASETQQVRVKGTFYQTDARSMLTKINKLRTEGSWYYNSSGQKVSTGKLKAFVYDYNLEKVAMQRAMEIAVSFGHYRPDGTKCWTAYSEKNYSYSSSGENIAAGYWSADSAFNGWLEEYDDYYGQGHRRNMLSVGSGYYPTTHIGIACVAVDGVKYWVQEFSGNGSVSTSKTAANDSSAVYAVNVLKTAVKSAEIYTDTSRITLEEGASKTMPSVNTYIHVELEGNYSFLDCPITNGGVTYSSSNTGVLTVSGSKITAKKAGSATVTATSTLDNTAKVSVPVTVKAKAKPNLSQAVVTLTKTSVTYTGSAQKPSVKSVVLNGKTLVSGTDYTVSYSNNTGIGTARVTITGKGNYTGSKTVNFTIKGDISKAAVTLTKTSVTYTGSAQKPSVKSVVLNGKTLVSGTNYTVSYSNNTGIGTARVTITGKGNYTGSKTVNFAIKGDISKAAVSLEKTTVTYTGSAQKPAVKSVVLNGKTLVSGTDYSVSYTNNVNIGTGKVTVTGKGNYTGTKTVTFAIKQDIAKCSVTLDKTAVVYSGSAQKPGVKSVLLSSKTLVSGTDYSVSWTNNVNVGTARVTVTGKGNYTGTRTVTFAITEADISAAKVSAIPVQTYSKKTDINPKFTVKLNNKTLTSGSDYSSRCVTNLKTGKAALLVEGTGNYTGWIMVDFSIKKK